VYITKDIPEMTNSPIKAFTGFPPLNIDKKEYRE